MPVTISHRRRYPLEEVESFTYLGSVVNRQEPIDGLLTQTKALMDHTFR